MDRWPEKALQVSEEQNHSDKIWLGPQMSGMEHFWQRERLVQMTWGTSESSACKEPKEGQFGWYACEISRGPTPQNLTVMVSRLHCTIKASGGCGKDRSHPRHHSLLLPAGVRLYKKGQYFQATLQLGVGGLLSCGQWDVQSDTYKFWKVTLMGRRAPSSSFPFLCWLAHRHDSRTGT